MSACGWESSSFALKNPADVGKMPDFRKTRRDNQFLTQTSNLPNAGTKTMDRDKKKVATELRRKDTKWRQLDGKRRAMVRRLAAVKSIEDREAAALERKAQKESGELVEAGEAAE
jgi:hypothetical protein